MTNTVAVNVAVGLDGNCDDLREYITTLEIITLVFLV